MLRTKIDVISGNAFTILDRQFEIQTNNRRVLKIHAHRAIGKEFCRVDHQHFEIYSIGIDKSILPRGLCRTARSVTAQSIPVVPSGL